MSQKPYDRGCHKRFEPACLAVMERILERRGNRILRGMEAVDAVRARLPEGDRGSYSPKLSPDFDLFVTDVVAFHPWFGIRMYELEARWKDKSERSHFDELKRYHFHGDGYADVQVPERKVVNGNVSDYYVGFQPMLEWLYMMDMNVIRRHHADGDIRVRPCYAHGILVREDRFVVIPNVPEEVTFVKIRPSSGPESLGLRFDEGLDRWIMPGAPAS